MAEAIKLYKGKNKAPTGSYVYIGESFDGQCAWYVCKNDEDAINIKWSFYHSRTKFIDLAFYNNIFPQDFSLIYEKVLTANMESKTDNAKKCSCPYDNFRWGGVGCKCGGR